MNPETNIKLLKLRWKNTDLNPFPLLPEAAKINQNVKLIENGSVATELLAYSSAFYRLVGNGKNKNLGTRS
jgi:hypothetical protein